MKIFMEPGSLESDFESYVSQLENAEEIYGGKEIDPQNVIKDKISQFLMS